MNANPQVPLIVGRMAFFSRIESQKNMLGFKNSMIYIYIVE